MCELHMQRMDRRISVIIYAAYRQKNEYVNHVCGVLGRICVIIYVAYCRKNICELYMKRIDRRMNMWRIDGVRFTKEECI